MSCTDDIDIMYEIECMKSYKFGPLIGGAIVFCLSIIIETFWVNYTLYFKPNKVNHIMCGIYAIGSLVIMVAAILELEMDISRGYYAEAPWLWIFGGILCLISQLHWTWILKSKNLSVTLAYIFAIVATVLWIIVGIDYVSTEPEDDSGLYTELMMLTASVLYIIHALIWFCAVYGTVSSQSKLE